MSALLTAALPAQLARHVWRGDAETMPAQPGLASGYAALDAVLPGGGWPVGAVTELLPEAEGIGELSLLMPMLAAQAAGERWVAWVEARGERTPYAPALAAAGLDLARLLLVRPAHQTDALWALRQCVASGACACVLGALRQPDTAALRRLQLAAEQSDCALILLRPATEAAQPSPAPLRLVLAPAPGGALRVQVQKRRGARLAQPIILYPSVSHALAGRVLAGFSATGAGAWTGRA
ncbi:MAG: translesion DNA synthesis-associated protein ImuA [Rhodocyclaceae bacterium]|nr:translesion DNA synthesis-associated protein ImuA [Rhodocyclaceae bacterium]MBX3671102.1 translesion DNA synthesis-associated protein ImuA [Rhodocyclaceae bacterium]